MADGAAPPDGHRPLASWSALLVSFRSLAAGEVAARALGLVAIVVMSRELEPQGFGLVIFGTTLGLWFRLIVDSGTELVNLRDISREPARFRELSEAVLGLRLAMSAVATMLYVAAVWLFTDDSSNRGVLLLFALTLPVVAINLRWIVLGVGRSKAVAVGNVGSQLLFAVGVLLLVNDRHDTLAVPILLAASELLYGVVVLVGVAREFGVLRPRIDLSAWRANLREGWPLMVNLFSRALVQSFDLFLIALVLGTAEAGLYGAAYKPILFFTVISGLLFNAFLASYSASRPAPAKELLRKTLQLGVIATVPIALALSVGSHLFVTLVFGSAYSAAAVALAILSWSIVLTTISTGYGRVLIAAGRQSTLMWHNLVAAILNIAVNLAVVPLAGIEGAAVVTLASEFLVVALNYRACARLGLLPSPRAMVGRGRGEITAVGS